MTDLEELVRRIEKWGEERGIDDAGGQLEKFFEEAGELAREHGKLNFARGMANALQRDMEPAQEEEDVADAIGDVTVTLILFAQAHGLDFGECLEHAYDEIKDREGEVVNGVFVKEGEDG